MSNGTSKAKGASGRAAKQSVKGAVKQGPVKQGAVVRPQKQSAKGAAKASPIGARTLIGVGVACVLLFAAFVVFTNQQAKPPAIGGAFQLTTQFEKPFIDKDMLGRPYLVFFGYTNCPDICHTTLFELSEIMRALGPDANVGGLFVTVDPERDTAPILKDYLSSFDPRIIGLSGTPEQTKAVEKSYRAYSKKVPDKDGSYTMDHLALTYLMDKTGQFVGAFNLEQPAKDAAAEYRRYF